MKFLVYGLQRSGTKLLRRVIERHFGGEYAGAWEDRSSTKHRHFRLYDRKDMVPTDEYINRVFVKKTEDLDMEADRIFVISKDPYSWDLSYERWWKANNTDPQNREFTFEWNLFYRKWKEIADERVVFVRYWDLLSRFRPCLTEMGLALGVEPADEAQEEFNRTSYYLQGKFFEDLGDVRIAKIKERIDVALMMSLGYEWCTKEAFNQWLFSSIE